MSVSVFITSKKVKEISSIFIEDVSETEADRQPAQHHHSEPVPVQTEVARLKPGDMYKWINLYLHTEVGVSMNYMNNTFDFDKLVC